MRQIEKNMIKAISKWKTWKQANTRTLAICNPENPLAEKVLVYLYDNHIATVYHDGSIEPNLDTFSAWPTQTTKSRLKALGIDVSIKKFESHINGQPI